MEHLDGMTLRSLRSDHPDTERLASWINTDVRIALEKGYLARLHLCICEDPQGKDVVEQYTYAFSYGTDAGVP